MDGETVEEAGAGAVYCGRHDDVRFHFEGESGADDGDVGGTLWVGGELVAMLEIGVEVWGGVDESTRFMVGAGDGLVGEV